MMACATQEYPWIDVTGFANQAMTVSLEFQMPQIGAYVGDLAA